MNILESVQDIVIFMITFFRISVHSKMSSLSLLNYWEEFKNSFIQAIIRQEYQRLIELQRHSDAFTRWKRSYFIAYISSSHDHDQPKLRQYSRRDPAYQVRIEGCNRGLGNWNSSVASFTRWNNKNLPTRLKTLALRVQMWPRRWNSRVIFLQLRNRIFTIPWWAYSEQNN